jgi:hypothetical protein
VVDGIERQGKKLGAWVTWFVVVVILWVAVSRFKH